MSDEVVPVLLVKYDDTGELDVDYDGEYPVVTNHDELAKTDIVRGFHREKLEELREEWGFDHDIVDETSPLWRDEFDDLAAGEEIALGERAGT